MTGEHETFVDETPMQSATEQILTNLKLFDYRPLEGEPDLRALPEDPVIEGEVADVFDALAATTADNNLDSDLNSVCGPP